MSTHRLPTRSWAYAVALLVAALGLTPRVTAGDGPPVEMSMENLEVALNDRVGELTDIPEDEKLPKKQRKEVKKLGQALDLVTAYLERLESQDFIDGKLVDHVEDAIDVKDMTRIAKLLRKAKTPVEAIVEQMPAVGDRLSGVGNHHRYRLAELQRFLLLDEHKLPLDAFLEAGDKRLAKWQKRWDKKGLASPKGLLAAMKRYELGRAEGMVSRVVEAEADPNDLSVTSVRAELFFNKVNGQYNPVTGGHRLKIRSTIRCEAFTPVLTVVYRATHKEGLATNQPRQFTIAEVTASDVPAGDYTFKHPIYDEGEVYPVPADFDPGDYYISAEVDPYDRVLELFADDSENNNFRRNLDQVVEFILDDVATPNLYLIDDLDGTFVDVDQIEIVKNGLFPQEPGLGIDVPLRLYGTTPVDATEVTIALRVFGVPGGVQEFAGRIWDEQTMDYESSLTLTDLTPGDSQFHLAATFPSLADYPAAQGSYSSLVVVDIDTTFLVDEFEISDQDDGNRRFYAGPDVVFMDELPPELAACSLGDSFEKTLGNGQFGASVLMTSGLNFARDIPGLLDNLPGGPPVIDPGPFGVGQPPAGSPFIAGPSKTMQGAVALATADVDVTIVGKTLDLVDFTVLGERDPFQQYSYFGADLKLLDKIVFSVGPVDSETLAAADKVGKLPKGLEYDKATGGLTYKVPKPKKNGDSSDDGAGDDDEEDNSFSLFGKKEDTKWFFPGGFPVRVENTLSGEYGFKLVFTANDAFTVRAGPFVEWKDELTAASCLGKICVGAGGELTLLKDEFTATIGTGMTPLVGPDPGDPGPERSIDVSSCFQLANRITVAAGELFAFATYPWCDLWFGAPYNCGIKKSKLNLLKWKGFVWDNVFFETIGQACCVKVDGDMDCPQDGSTVCDLPTVN